MTEDHSTQPPSALTNLLIEFIDRREVGKNVDLQDLERRAGKHWKELRERIRMIEDLERISLFSGDGSQQIFSDSPRQIGRFRIKRLLGKGGLSRVFLAEDPRLGREVALKVLSPTSVDLSEARSWMVTEGRSLAQLDHPGIVRVFELEEADGMPYIAMERIAGPSLYSVIDIMRAQAGLTEIEEGQSDPDLLRAARGLESIGARIRLVAELAKALAYSHERGVVHRDIKPGNVLVAPDGTPKLIDFGLAHLEDVHLTGGVTHNLFGTPGYLSPEQVEQGRTGVSPASDQFALGILLYELLSLTHPFPFEAPAVYNAICSREPAPLGQIDSSLPEALNLICLHCLEKRPEDRYPRVIDLASDLEAFLGYHAISLKAPTPWQRMLFWLKRRREQAKLVAAVALFVALALGLGSGYWKRFELIRTLEADRERLLSLPLDTIAQAEELFEELDRHGRQAAQLDASWAALLFPDVTPEYRSAWSDARDQAARLARESYAKAEAFLLPEGRRTALDAIEKRTDGLRSRVKSSAPPGEEGSIQGPLACVRLPAGELYRRRFSAIGCVRLEPVESERPLDPGAYRFRSADGRLTEFFVHENEPEWSPPLRPLADWLEQRLVDVQSIDVPLADTPPESFRVQAFRISPTLITWEDVMRVFPRERLEETLSAEQRLLAGATRRAESLSMEASEPARLPRSLVEEFARLTGTRIPDGSELRAAHEQGLLEDAGENQEWSSTVDFQRGLVFAVNFAEIEDGPARWISDIAEAGLTPDIYFRVAHDAPW